jgi:hypothetical protein
MQTYDSGTRYDNIHLPDLSATWQAHSSTPSGYPWKLSGEVPGASSSSSAPCRPSGSPVPARKYPFSSIPSYIENFHTYLSAIDILFTPEKSFTGQIIYLKTVRSKSRIPSREAISGHILKLLSKTIAGFYYSFYRLSRFELEFPEITDIIFPRKPEKFLDKIA